MMMKRLCALLTALMLMLCAVSALAEDADPVLATVNGEEVRESTKLVQSWKNYLMSQAGSEPDAETLQTVNQYAMNYALEFITAKQKLAELGLGYTQEDLDAATNEARLSWDEAVSSIMEEELGISADATDEEKAAGKADAIAYIQENYGYTEESFLAEVELNLIYTRTMEYAKKDVEVTDEEIEAYFQQMVENDRQMLINYAGGDGELSEEELNKAMVTIYEYYTQYGYSLLYTPEGYRGITHILLPVDEELLKAWTDLQARLEEQNSGETEATDGEETTTEAPEEPVTQEMVDAAKQAILDSVKEKTDEIAAKLAEGASFEDLITEYGTDPGMQDDERRANGYPVHAGSITYDSNFADAAMALQNIGDISEPVVTQFGVHLLHYLRDIPGGAVEYTDDVKETMKNAVTEEKESAAYSALMEKWMAESEIVWTEAGEPWKMPEEEAAAEEDAAEEATTEETAE